MSQIRTSHVSHTNESCHTYLFQTAVPRKQVISHESYDCVIYGTTQDTYEWVMSHIWMSHVTHMNELCHTYEWVMSHVCMSHVTSAFSKRPSPANKLYTRIRHATHMNESCHKYQWVMAHLWMSHFKHMNESCHTYEWVNADTWISQVAHTNESRTRMSHVTHTNESCHTHLFKTAVPRKQAPSSQVDYRNVLLSTHMNEPCHTYERVMSRIHRSHVTSNEVEYSIFV